MEHILETAQSIGVFLAQIILSLYFCKQYLANSLKKTDIAKMLPKQNKLDIELMQKMEYVKEMLNADRIHIYEFHDGDFYSEYRHAYKFSCTYEVVKAGSKSLRDKCMGVPTSLLPKFVNKITEDGLFFCKDIDEIKDSMPSTFGFKHAYGIRSFYDIAIKNSKNQAIGFIAVQWDNKDNVKIDEDLIKQLKWYVEEHLTKSK